MAEPCSQPRLTKRYHDMASVDSTGHKTYIARVCDDRPEGDPVLLHQLVHTQQQQATCLQQEVEVAAIGRAR